MNRVALSVIIVTCFAARVASVEAQAPDWTDACNYPLSIPSQQQDSVKRLLEAEGVLLQESDIQVQPDGTFRLAHPQAFLAYTDPTSTTFRVCQADSIFRGDTQLSSQVSGNGFRSGVLVGPDLFAFAPHQINFPLGNKVVVFGLNKGGLNAGCSAGNYDPIIQPSDVQDWDGGQVYAFDPNQPLDADMEVMRLSGSPLRRWVRMRTSGAPSEDDVIAIAGHPFQLPTKLEYGIMYAGTVGNMSPPYDPTLPMFYGFHLAEGSSGSPVFNVTKDVLETVVRGPFNNFTDSIGISLDSFGACTAGFYLPDGSGEAGITIADAFDGEHVLPTANALNLGKIETIAVTVPTIDPKLTPLQDTVYDIPVGGNPTPSSSTYTLKASPAGDSFGATATILPPPAGQPALLTNGANMPYSGQLTPGQTVTFGANADVPHTLGCGTYDRFLQVSADGYTDFVRHRFEVGLEEISVEPTDDWIVNDFGAPIQQTRTYAIKNLRLTPVTVYAAQGGSSALAFVLPSGATNFSLGAAGSGTESATFDVGINQNSDAATTLGVVYESDIDVSIVNPHCPVMETVQRHVKYKRGEQQFSSIHGPALLPLPRPGQTFGTPVRFDLDLSNEGNFCTRDINLDVGIPTGTIGLGLPNAAPYLKIQLTAPSGQTGILWNGQAIPPGADYVIEDVTDGFPGTATHLHLDDSTTLPLGPQTLSVFNSAATSGVWHVDVSRSNGSPAIYAGDVRIDLTRRASCIGGGT